MPVTNNIYPNASLTSTYLALHLALVFTQINTHPSTNTNTTNQHHRIVTAVTNALASFPTLFLKLHRLALVGEILEMAKRIKGLLSFASGLYYGQGLGPGLGSGLGQGQGSGSGLGLGSGQGLGLGLGLTVKASYALAEAVDDLLWSLQHPSHPVSDLTQVGDPPVSVGDIYP